MKRLASFIAIFILAFVHFNLKAEPTTIPSILNSFLRDHPEYHLVTTSDFIDENKKQAFLHQHEGSGFHSAVFRVMDTNRDGRDDVVAIMVKNGLFNALVFQAKPNGFLHTPFWLVRDSQETIAGVFFDKGDSIVLNNLDCCYSPWVFGWTGSNYELGIKLPGSFVCINSSTAIYPDTKTQSTPLLTIRETVGATVVKIGMKQGDDRWYLIKLKNKTARTGYILSKNLGDATDCASLANWVR